jgi:Zn-dependent M16 (insulinase) family peptidase
MYGGNPNDITQLTYLELIDFHKKYYHPSNAKIFTYGNMEIE